MKFLRFVAAKLVFLGLLNIFRPTPRIVKSHFWPIFRLSRRIPAVFLLLSKISFGHLFCTKIESFSGKISFFRVFFSEIAAMKEICEVNSMLVSGRKISEK